MKNQKEKPIHEQRIGAIKAAIWRNETPSGVRFKVTFSRLYKERPEESWKSTDSFGQNDLLLLAKVADAAHTWIRDQRTEPASVHKGPVPVNPPINAASH